MFDLEFTYHFSAAHRFIHSTSPLCSTPHGHTWQASLIFSAPIETLNSQQVIQPFTTLKQSWKFFITEVVDHSFFYHHDDPIVPAIQREIPDFRGLPFPGDPTTELVAVLFLAKAITMIQNNKHRYLLPSRITIQETPTNKVSYFFTHSSSSFVELIASKTDGHNGWWNDVEPCARWIRPVDR